MRVALYTSLEQLTPLAPDWDRLARGVPFRSWTWLSTWWRHYGAGTPQGARDLFVAAVLDRSDRVLAIAPWFRESSAARGRVVRFMGSGEICSDYLSILCLPGTEDTVTQALAEWLVAADHSSRSKRPWDLLELSGIDADDAAALHLAGHLEALGLPVDRRAGANCWRLPLPGRWQDYLDLLSKSHRKQLRRLERDLVSTGRAVHRRIARLGELPGAWKILVDLHQRRHRGLGQPGAFHSERFCGFHGEVMPGLLTAGQLCLDWVELDGRPVAAEYQLVGDGVIYAYQSGVDPDALRHSPGRLSTLLQVRLAIEQGYVALDLLRGDEPYKSHCRARPRPSVELRVAAPRAAARLRHRVWIAGSNVKRWLKNTLQPQPTPAP